MRNLFLAIIATGLILAGGCKKETLMDPAVSSKSINKENNIVINSDDASKLKKDANLFLKIVQQIDTSLTNGFIRGEISEDILFEKLPSELQFKVLDATDLINEEFMSIKTKYQINTLKSINWNRSFIKEINLTSRGVDNCEDNYNIQSAANLAEFYATATWCMDVIEAPIVAAGCIMGAAAWYGYQQTTTYNNYVNCLHNNNN